MQTSLGNVVERVLQHVHSEKRLGCTPRCWRGQNTNRHRSRVSNGPTEAANNRAKLIERVPFGTANFDHYRIRVLLCAGKPDWSLLDTLTSHSHGGSTHPTTRPVNKVHGHYK